MENVLEINSLNKTYGGKFKAIDDLSLNVKKGEIFGLLGAKGIRVTKTEEISAAFEEAKKNTKTPTLIEFIIDPEEMVYPMIKPGGTLEDMIMDC